MTAVSNTPPLNYLILTGFAEILPKVFSEILIPEAVLDELQSHVAPLGVRNWVMNPPEWLQVEASGAVDRDLRGLDRGESEAITLAERRSVALVLLDEKKARRVARERGLLVAGTLAVLDRAATMEIVDIAEALERLKKTSFRASPSLIRSILTRHRK